MNKITPDYLVSLSPSYVKYIEIINNYLTIAAKSGERKVSLNISRAPIDSKKRMVEYYIDSGFNAYLEDCNITIEW